MTLQETPPSPNRVHAIERTGVLVSTDASRARGDGPQLVEPRMIQVACDALRADGTLTNRHLLDELRVMRSSFVCAALATLPEVEVVGRRPITLRWREAASEGIAAEPAGDYG